MPASLSWGCAPHVLVILLTGWRALHDVEPLNSAVEVACSVYVVADSIDFDHIDHWRKVWADFGWRHVSSKPGDNREVRDFLSRKQAKLSCPLSEWLQQVSWLRPIRASTWRCDIPTFTRSGRRCLSGGSA